MPILGLMHSEQFASERFKDIRRSVFYFFPNGASPLMGILSLLGEEVTNDPEFKWYEKRLDEQRSVTASIAGNVCFYSAVSADFATWTQAAADLTPTIDTTQYGVKVASTASFRVGQVLKINVIVAAVAVEMQVRISYVDTTNTRVAFFALTSPGAITYGAAAGLGQEVLVIGNAWAEGAVGSSTAAYNLPVNPSNYTQIFRTAYQITGTALKTSTKFDESGIQDDQAEDASTAHMMELEKAFLFGNARQVQSGNNTATRYTGGILYFLRQWEAANSIYRGGAGAPAITANTDDAKRIVTLVDGYLSHKWYSNMLERAFRVTNNRANEKLVLCGSGFLNVVNQMYEGRASLEVKPPTKDTYGMDITTHVTPFGTVHYKTHPMFTQNAIMRNNALFLDVNNLTYRNIAGRDTVLKEGTQPNNADYVENEYLTEAGLELQAPESHLYLQNVLDFK